jgi:hypothetical protein
MGDLLLGSAKKLGRRPTFMDHKRFEMILEIPDLRIVDHADRSALLIASRDLLGVLADGHADADSSVVFQRA